jgi:methyl-accepting chemotaxis protein
MKKIIYKVFILVSGSILVLGIFLTVYMLNVLTNSNEKTIKEFESVLKTGFDIKLQEEVQIVVSLLQAISEEHQNGAFSMTEAKKRGADLVRKLRFGNEGYFWIDDVNGNNVVLLGRDAEGKNRLESKDAKGYLLVKDFIKKGVNGGGFTEYWFPKKGGGESFPKRGYTLLFKPFDWVVGSGNYHDEIESKIAEKRETLRKNTENTRILLIVFIIIATSIIIILSLLIFRRIIVQPVAYLSAKAKEISEGNLYINILVKQKDEIGFLGNALNTMVIKLKEVINVINENVQNVSSGTEQISLRSQQIAQGANEQAATVEEISSSIEEMVSAINQNTENAQQTEKIAIHAEIGINEAKMATSNTLETMRSIADKIKIIREIASKTALLAINAAIEASKAGEYGKGFAVIASEIRKLSENTQKATQIITDLTNSSLIIAEKAETVLNEIVPDVHKTARLVQEIAAASIEQNTNANQINKAVQQFSAVIQQNSSLAEELSTGAEELSAQSHNLKDTVRFFNLKGTENNISQFKKDVMQYLADASRKAENKNFDNFDISITPKDKSEKNNVSKSYGVNIKLDDNERDNEFERY